MESSFESTQSDRLRRYFLGQLSPEEAEETAERILDDDEFDQQADEVADQLVVDYAAGALSAGERVTVNALLTIPEWRRRLDVASGLRKIAARESGAGHTPALLSGPRARPRSLPRWLSAAAAIVAVAALSLWQQARGAAEASRSALQASMKRIDSMQSALDSAREASGRVQLALAQQQTVDWALTPGTLRGGSRTPSLPARATYARLQLAVLGELPTSRLFVRISRGDQVFSNTAVPQTGVRRAEGVVELVVSRAALPSGALIVTLFGVDPSGMEQVLGTYDLRVAER